MVEQTTKRLALVLAASVLVASAAALACGRALAAGVLAGGLWHLASLGCLANLLRAWMTRQPKRRVLPWIVAKVGLYLIAYGVLWVAHVSVVGFGIGFSLVLMVAVAGFAWNTQQMAMARHGQ